MDFIDHRSNATFQFKISSTDEKARVDNSGNLLIGKSSTSFSTVGAEVRGVGQLWATRDGGVPISANRLSSDGYVQTFYKAGALVGGIGTINSTLTIGSGDTGILFNESISALYPWDLTANAGSNGLIDLGISDRKWKDLHIGGTANIGGNAIITGDLTVNGTTTTINTATLDVEDKNITLNYGAGDTSSTADGAGITIQDAVDASNDATILWNATNDKFVFSHAIDVTGTVVADGLTVNSGAASTTLNFQNSGTAYSTLYNDTNGVVIFSADAGNTGAAPRMQLNVGGQQAFRITDGGDIFFYEDTGTTAKLTWDASAETLNFADNGKAVFGAGSDLQIYHDGSNSYVKDNGTGGLILEGTTSTQIKGSSFVILRSTAGENMAVGNANGSFDLYYDNAKKLATTATGIDVTGTATMDGLNIEGAGAGLANFYRASANANFSAITFKDTTNTNINAKIGWNANELRLDGTNSVRLVTDAKNRLLVSSIGDISFYESTGVNQKFYWDASTEFLGLGSTAPAAKLDIVDTSADVQMRVYKNDGTKNTRVTLTADDSGAKIHYRDADNAGALRFNNNLGEVMRITANTTRLGIGTSSAQQQLHVHKSDSLASAAVFTNSTTGSSSSDGVFVGLGSGEQGYLWNYENNDVILGTNNTERLRIDSSGRVGVGTSSPSAKLGINASAPDFTMLQSDVVKFRSGVSGTTNGGVTGSASGDYFTRTAGGKMLFSTNDGVTAHAVIDSAGNVGIGQAPTAFSNWKVLELKGGTAGAMLNFENSASTRVSTVAYDDGSDKLRIQNFLANPITFETDNTERMRIDSSGRVGIGASPSTNVLLHVQGEIGTTNGTASDPTHTFYGDPDTGMFRAAVNTLGMSTAGTERMRIDASGNLLVGKTTTSNATAGAELNASGQIVGTFASGTHILGRNSNDGSILEFQKDGSTVGSINARSGDLLIGTTDVGLRFDDNASAYIPFNVTTSLGRDAGIDLGAASVRYKDLHLSGTAYVGTSIGIGTSPSKTLDVRTSGGSDSVIRVGSSGHIGINVNVGTIEFYSADSDDAGVKASIANYVTGNQGPGGNVDGNLVFSTTDSDGGGNDSPTERMRIDSAGNVGVGVTPENSSGTWRNFEQGGMNLAGRSAGGVDGMVGTNYVFKTNNSEVYKYTAGTSRLFFDANEIRFQQAASGTAGTAISWSEAMRIDSSGRVGIGTSSPATKLDVVMGTGNRLLFTTTGSDTFVSSVNEANNAYSNLFINGAVTKLGTGGTERMRIDASGNVGIGTSSIDFQASNRTVVHVEGSAGALLAMEDTGAKSYLFQIGNDLLIENDTSTGSMIFGTNASTERMRIDSSGNVGIGTSSPSVPVHGYKSQASPTIVARFENPADEAIVEIKSKNTDLGVLQFADTEDANVGAVQYSHSDNSMRFKTNDSERMRIDANGKVGINVSSPSSYNANWNDLCIGSGTSAGATIVSGTTGIGTLAFADGTTGNEQYRGYLQYSHSTDHLELGTAGTERLRIDSSGRVGIGTSSPSSSLTTEADSGVLVTDASGLRQIEIVPPQTSNGFVGEMGTRSSHPLVFNTVNTERTRIDASGNQLWGKTAANNTTQGIRFLGSSGFMSIVRSNATAIIVNRIDGDGTLMEFRTSGTTRGSISISGSTTSYNTTSDERAKQNIEDADDAGAIVDSIQVRKFDWIDGGEHQRYGMVAQELSTVAPEAVSVPDDAEEMQSVDYSKLVPMMLKEIQSLRARVAQLEGEN